MLQKKDRVIHTINVYVLQKPILLWQHQQHMLTQIASVCSIIYTGMKVMFLNKSNYVCWVIHRQFLEVSSSAIWHRGWRYYIPLYMSLSWTGKFVSMLPSNFIVDWSMWILIYFSRHPKRNSEKLQLFKNLIISKNQEHAYNM